jgi:cation-transporting P-type ATPase 13A2
MSESVPSSVASFAHRRSRHDSTTSFTYFQEQDETPDWPDEEAVEEEPDHNFELDEDREDQDRYSDDRERDLESGDLLPRLKSSGQSRTSVDQPLLARLESSRSGVYTHGRDGRQVQKLYIETEDLTIVIAGFSTSVLGFGVYVGLCSVTLGLAYLLFRWLPKWKVRMIGTPSSLRQCSWVVIEVSSWHGRPKSTSPAKRSQNEWGEFQIQNVVNQKYGRALSTVFGSSEKEASYEYNDDDDPVLTNLRFLDYRYIRFCFHPLKDNFILSNSWKDPQWTDVKTLRVGLDSDERDRREQVFGKNMIEIEQKSNPQLLVDEVSYLLIVLECSSTL